MRLHELAVLVFLGVGCSSPRTERTIDEVPRYLGTGFKVTVPPGEVLGQATVKHVDSSLSKRLMLYIRANGQVERGNIEINTALPFELSDVERKGNRIEIRRSSDLSYEDVLRTKTPVFRWTHRAVRLEAAPEQGTTEVNPSGSLPEVPGPLPESSDVYFDIGGPGYVARASIDLDVERKLMDTLTVVPRYALNLESGTIDQSKVYTVSLSGVASVGCLLEAEFSSSEVGLENDGCSGLFSGFAGPLNP